MTPDDGNTPLSPQLNEIILSKEAFFKKYEPFIDFYELERLVERRGKLTMPELALHIVRIRGQRLLEIAKVHAAAQVYRASQEDIYEQMKQAFDEYQKASEKAPELAQRYEKMIVRLLDTLEDLPFEAINKFKSRFS